MVLPHLGTSDRRRALRRRAPVLLVAAATVAVLLGLAATLIVLRTVEPPPRPVQDTRVTSSALAVENARLRRQLERLRRASGGPGAAMESPNFTRTLNVRLEELQRRNRELERGPHATASAAAPEPATCAAAYLAATRDRTPGLSEASLTRAQAHVGNRQRLDFVAQTLTARERPLNVVVFGGSISMGHGVKRNISIGSESYQGHLEHWLNQAFPVGLNATRRHRVINMSQHGVDICFLAKRMDVYSQTLLEAYGVREPDLILLEYAVNDYQGQDHVENYVSQLDVFFPGFQDIALCGEVVVNQMLNRFQRSALIFLEFRTAVPQRKTAQMLHFGVAQHYQVPVISYADAVFPEYLELLHNLNTSLGYTRPVGETILPFPYGCHECRTDHITDQFRQWYKQPGKKDCLTVCQIMLLSHPLCKAAPPPGQDDCHPALFSVDEVHPSALGHRIAADLVSDAIAGAVRRHCDGESFRPHILPSLGWLATPATLKVKGNFLLVQDAHCFSMHCAELQASKRTSGFELYADKAGKMGWIATNATGGETIEFDIQLPEHKCYVVYLAILRSYEGMGKMQVTVSDKDTNFETTSVLDGLWDARISVWSDNQLTSDETAACSGNCSVRVQTLSQEPDRSGNKVKILTLSVRECIEN